MKNIVLQAFEDSNRPEGGHAVVLLQGVADIPEATAFRIRPADTTSEVAPGWPNGDHYPVQRRRADDGVEIVIGPDVANNEFLIPGMVVAIEFPSLGLAGELLWPNVAPLRLPKRSKLGVTRSRRAAGVGQAPPSTSDEPPSVEAAAATPAAPEPDDAPPPIATPADPADQDERPAAPAGVLSEHDASWPVHGGEAPAGSAARANIRRGANGAHLEPRPTHTPPAYHSTMHHAAAQSPSTDLRWAAAPIAHATSPSVTTASTAAPQRTLWTLSPAKAAGIAIAAGILGALASVAALAPDRIFGHSSAREANATTQAAPSQTRPAQVPTSADLTDLGQAAAEPGGLMFDALTAGTVSPRGVSATGLPLSKVLENATSSAIAGGAPADTEEAAFWRKRYIAGALGDDRTMRALTQLGSVYAEPTGRQPDFVRARLMWEIASAIGDPVAMCFLGQLHENGLGVAADKRIALQWYERAKQAGGCPSLTESLARVRQ